MTRKSSSQTSIGKSLKFIAGFALLNLMLLLFPIALEAATYYSRVATGNFNAPASWSTSDTGSPTNGTALAATDIFIIQNGHNITVTANQTIASITVNAGGTLTSAAAIVLTVAGGAGGTWTNNGTFVPSTGTVTFSGIVSIAGTGTGSFNLVSIAASCTLTINTPVTIGSNLSFVAANPTSTISIAGSNTLAVTGTVTMANITTGTRSSTLAVGDGTLTVGGTYTMSAASSSSRTNNLTVNNGTINLQGITTASAFARITTTGTGTINISGLVTATGTPTITAGSGTINYNRANTQTVFTGTYFNLTIGGTSAKTITTASTFVTGTFAMEGTATYSAIPTYSGSAYGLRYSTSDARNTATEWPATFSGTRGVTITSSTITVPAANPKTFPLDVPLTISGGALTTGANNFTLSGDFINTGTWTSSTGQVIITGTRASQVIGSFTTTGLVSFTKASQTATLTGAVLGGAFTMNGAGTLNLGTGLTHVFTGNWTNTAGTLEGNTSTLRIGGTSSGTGVTFTRNTSTVDFNGSGAQNIPTFIYHNLQTSTGNTKTLDGDTEVTGVLTINASNAFSLSNRVLTLSGAGTPFVATGTFTPSTGTIIYTNATSNVTATTYTNLQTSGDQTLAGGTTVTGVLTINSGTLFAGANTITLSGTGTPFVSSGTFNAGTSTVLYSNATATIAPLTYYNLQTQTAGTKTLGGNTSVSNVLTVGASSILAPSTFTLNLSGTGTPFVVTGTFTAGTSTVNFNGTGAQNIPALTYHNLNTSTGDTKTLLGNTTVSNVLNIGSSSTFATGAFTLTLSGTGTPLVDNGTFTATAGGTVIYSGATANIAAESYANLQTSTAGVKTLAGNTTVATVLTINSPSTLATGANTLTLTGTGTPLVDNGTFTASPGGTVIFSGATATVAGETYANLQVSTAGAKTLGANTTVGEVLTINTGSTIALSTFTLTLSGTGTPVVNSGGTFTPATGTVIYSGATSNIAALSYYNLQTSTAGSKTLAGATTVSNILTINSPSTLDLSTFTINLSLTGTPLVNNGTIAGTGTVNFSGSGAQTVAGTTYPNLEFSGAGTKTIAAAATIVVTTNWVVGSTTTMTTTAAADVGGNISGSGAITMGSGTINIAGNWTNNGTFTRGTGTVIYDGTTQSVGGVSYYNLQTSNSGVKTLAAGTTVANILTIGTSTNLDLSSFTLTLSGAGTPLVNNGTFTCSTSTVSFSNAASTNIPALNYYNLTLTGGARVLANSGTIGIANIFTPGAGGFTVTGSTVNFNGMGAQTIPAFTFNDMVLSGSGAKTILTATTVTVNEININDGPELDLPGTAVINITKP